VTWSCACVGIDNWGLLEI